MQDPTQTAYDGMLLAPRSASGDRAVPIMRAGLERNTQQTIADELPGADAAVRATLLVAICTGVQLMRNVLHSSALLDSDPEVTAGYLAAALNVLATAPSADERTA